LQRSYRTQDGVLKTFLTKGAQMTDYLAITSDQVKQAAAALKKLRPTYLDLLDYYQQIFVAQEDSRSQLKIEPIKISAEILTVKKNDQFPLITISEFVIDTNSAATLLKRICQIAEAANKEMAATAEAIRNAIESDALDPGAVFSNLLKADDTFFNKVESELNIEKKILSLLAYNSLKPSLTHCALQLSSYLDEDDVWEKGYCPICGSTPAFSMFENEGKRFLICSFCWHRWLAPRIYCPFCDNRDSKTLHYLYSDQEKDYRIDVCDSCKTYIKVVDTRKADRIIYPPLEFVATLHLDIKAQEMGFKSGIPLELQ
jgi:FdhE protein